MATDTGLARFDPRSSHVRVANRLNLLDTML
jgi:hypothetical protein